MFHTSHISVRCLKRDGGLLTLVSKNCTVLWACVLLVIMIVSQFLADWLYIFWGTYVLQVVFAWHLDVDILCGCRR